MGSFDATCSVSGLPIQAGDPVFLILLRKTGDKHRHISPRDRWEPVAYPIRGKYNDYGQLEGFEADRGYTDLWKAFVDENLVEKGVGDNCCHDVAVTRSMSMGALMDVMWEGRLCFKGKAHVSARPRYQAGVPVFQEVGAYLTANGFDIEKFLLDDVERPGLVRVRLSGYNPNEGLLRAAQDCLAKRYAVALTTGWGNYGHNNQLVVYPKPWEDLSPEDRAGDERYDTSFGIPPLNPLEHRMTYAFIREDVWQSLLNRNIGGTRTLQDLIEGSKQITRKVFADIQGGKCFIMNLLMEAVRDVIGDNQYDDPLMALINLTSALIQHYTWCLFHILGKRLSDEQTLELLDTLAQKVAEDIWAEHVLYDIRHVWSGLSTVGPQFDDWKAHVEHHKAMLALAKAGLSRVERDN